VLHCPEPEATGCRVVVAPDALEGHYEEPVERLWRSGKQPICANRQYPSIDEVVERFLVYLYWLAPQEARRKAGLLSKPCWLKPSV
jgi:hypothetical protein